MRGIASKKNWSWLLWIFVFISTFLFRLISIDSSPLSYDEIISVKDTLLDFGHIKHESEWDTNPPFYYYVLWVWAKVFGISEFSVRAMSAFFSALTCAIAGRFLHRNAGANIAAVFVILFAFHPALFNYAQEARCYSLLLFLCVISLIVFYQFLEKDHWKYSVYYGLVTFLLFYTHYLSIVVPIIQFIFILIFRKEKWVKLFFGYLIVLLLVLMRFTKPQLLLIFGVSTNSIGETWIKKAVFSDLLHFYQFAYFHVLLYLLIIGLALYFLSTRGTGSKSLWIILSFSLLVSLLSPVFLFLLGIKVPVFINRYLLYSVLFSLIVYAYAITELKKLGWVLLLGMVLVETSQLQFGQSKGMDYRSVARFVKKIEGAPRIIIYKKDVVGLFSYYYDREIFKNLKYNDKALLNEKNIFDAGKLEDFKEMDFSGEKKVLLFQTFDNSKTNPDIYDFFKSKGYNMISYSLFEGVKFVLFTKP